MSEQVRIIDCLPPHDQDRHPTLSRGSRLSTWIFVGVCVGILAYVVFFSLRG